MRNKIEAQHESGARAGQSLRLPVQSGGSAPGSASARAILPIDVQGTIGATVGPVEEWSYGSLSGNWIFGEPLGSASAREQSPADVKPRLRAKDLIAELDSINAQIHRIMFQVERAVSRLATSG